MILEWSVDSDDPEEVRAQMAYYLNGVVQANRIIMLRERIPPLYKSGVRYGVPADLAHVQRLLNCRQVIAERSACCTNLAAWRCAELRNAAPSEAEAALCDIDVQYRAYASDPLGVGLVPGDDGVVHIFHATVVHPDGRIEDPSKKVRQ